VAIALHSNEPGQELVLIQIKTFLSVCFLVDLKIQA